MINKINHMSRKQIIDVCKKYDVYLENKGITEIRMENDIVGSLVHIRWMLNEIINLLNHISFDQSKVDRWLGFIQGVLWSNGFFTISEMRNDNRSK